MDIVMPQLGETVSEGTVSAWFKKPGDTVEKDETILEVETDKVTTEIPALIGGTLTEILVPAGETVAVGVKLAVIDGGDGQAVPEPAPATKPAKRARLSPVVRRLLAQHGIEAGDIAGSGDGGRITRKDVLAHVEAKGGVETEAMTRTIPFNATRKRTAEHMLRSKATSPHVLQAIEVDFHNVDNIRGARREAFKAQHGFSLTYLPFIAHAACLAIADFPHVNAHVHTDDGGQSLVVHRQVNLAIAVDLNFDGLVAPVVKNAGALSVTALATEIRALSQRARDGKLRPDDVTGGTYSISNSGSFGTLLTAPIINQPQVAILSSDGIAKKPVVVEGPHGEAIAIHPVGVLAQSFDHRAIDGAYSAAYLRQLKAIIEQHDWAAALD